MATSTDFIVKSGLLIKANTTIPDSTNFVTTDIVRAVAVPSLDINFSKTTSLDSRIQFSRASIGSYVGKNGYINFAQVNEPRIEYSTTGTCLGLLIEDPRTNLFLYSQQFTNWNKNSISVIDNAGISPSGQFDASVVTCIPGSGAHLSQSSISLNLGVTYTLSAFVKAGTTSTFIVERYDNNGLGGTGYFTTFFNVATGTIISNSGNNIVDIRPYPNGWFRISVGRQNALAGVTPGTMYIGAYGPSSGNMYIWGAQLEASTFPTSYIPTTTTNIARQGDAVTLQYDSWWPVPSQGSMIIKFDSFGIPAVQRGWLFNYSDTGNYRLSLRGNASSNVSQIVAGDGTGSIVTLTSLMTMTNYVAYTVGASFGGNTVSICTNGSTVANGSVTNNIFPKSANPYVEIGQSAANNSINGHISRIRFWPTRVSDAQLKFLTTI